MISSQISVEVDCGKEPGDSVTVAYSGGSTSNVVKMFSPNNLDTCAVTKEQSVGGVYTLTDARTNCEFIQPVSILVVFTIDMLCSVIFIYLAYSMTCSTVVPSYHGCQV